ncbi:hypothetical protein M514_04757 [Trichuris suis]|uniref:Uncharacterized protein n=1 Tax=Trichuris suis TaxID=68888 RepID=A0A085MWU1_9BILA|nr:hypothetical protein M513_04757 [Trichuris suis]KFD61687.1 hypothetical protein M514_04757 [Trichuris suis]
MGIEDPHGRIRKPPCAIAVAKMDSVLDQFFTLDTSTPIKQQPNMPRYQYATQIFGVFNRWTTSGWASIGNMSFYYLTFFILLLLLRVDSLGHRNTASTSLSAWFIGCMQRRPANVFKECTIEEENGTFVPAATMSDWWTEIVGMQKCLIVERSMGDLHRLRNAKYARTLRKLTFSLY